MKKIALVSMPFGALDRPSFGISLLKASLNKQGFDCDVRYLLEDFVDAIGLEDYEWLTDGVPYTSFTGDWIFTRALYGECTELNECEYIENILGKTWNLQNADVARILSAREKVEAYLNECTNTLDLEQYDIVGFTSTFTQNIASLALAKRIKAKFSNIQIIFGGANWEGEMGLTLHTQFPFVDYACSGEADISFPKLVQLLDSDMPLSKNVKGVVFRNSDGQSELSDPAAPVINLNNLPIPDFSDYFKMIRTNRIFASVSPSLIMETSRGCWWGAKHHCTFCGLNGNGMTFRVKDSDRALDELKELVNQWKVNFVSMVDNIIDMAYFDSFIVKLAECKLDVQLFYETKSNLKRKQVKALTKAKVWNIQPGIESLSDHVLQLMRKGTSALRNVQLLKWCKEYNISVDWNIVFGFPGESSDDYVDSYRILTRIPHLQPPSGSGPIRLDRFSPYFESPQKYGLQHVRAMQVFKYLYPFDSDTINKIACYFDFDYVTPQNSQNEVSQLLKLVDQLNQHEQRGDLRAQDTGNELMISDSRVGFTKSDYRLGYYDRALYLLIDEVSSAKTVVREFKRLFKELSFESEEIKARLEQWVTLGLAVKDKDKYLALAIYNRFPYDWKSSIGAQRPHSLPNNRLHHEVKL